MATQKKFLASIFDFKFESFITPRLIKFFYALLTGIVLVASLVFMIYGLWLSFSGNGSILYALTVLVVVPLAALLYLILVRSWFEFVLVIFKIKENTEARAD